MTLRNEAIRILTKEELLHIVLAISELVGPKSDDMGYISANDIDTLVSQRLEDRHE